MTDDLSDDYAAEAAVDEQERRGIVWCVVGRHETTRDSASCIGEDWCCRGCDRREDGELRLAVDARGTYRDPHGQPVRDAFSETLLEIAQGHEDMGRIDAQAHLSRVENCMRELLRRQRMRLAVVAAGLEE